MVEKVTKRTAEMVEGALRVAGEYKARAEAAEKYLTECRRIMDVLDVSDQELMRMGEAYGIHTPRKSGRESDPGRT